MESSNDKQDLHERLAKAYDQIIDHAAAALSHARNDTVPHAKHILEAARDKTVELGDVTRAEADKALEYVRRDLGHAAVYMETYQRDLSDWLRFDLQMLEKGLAKTFSKMVDKTREVIDDFAIRADIEGWKTGEVVGPGTLHCKNCQQPLHFHKTGHIPPCPKCQHTAFEREHDIG